jgi:hypothetical protein
MLAVVVALWRHVRDQDEKALWPELGEALGRLIGSTSMSHRKWGSSGFSVGDPQTWGGSLRCSGAGQRRALAVVGVAPAASGAATQAKGRGCRPSAGKRQS